MSILSSTSAFPLSCGLVNMGFTIIAQALFVSIDAIVGAISISELQARQPSRRFDVSQRGSNRSLGRFKNNQLQCVWRQIDRNAVT